MSWKRVRQETRVRLGHWHEMAALLYSALIVAVGVSGLVGAPSMILTETLGWSVFVYSVGMLGAGVTMFLSLLMGWRRSEVVGLIGVTVLTLLHSLIIMAASGDGGMQTSLRLMAASVGAASWAGARWARGLSRAQIEHHVKMLDERVVERE